MVRLGVGFATRELVFGDAGYPAALRTISDPPRVLHVRGSLHDEDAVAVGIVGTRRASAYGLAAARALARGLAGGGVTVVSGLARGIDAAAHQGAIDAGGRTIAVLGCGADIVYPPEHRALMEAVIECGAVVSEFPDGTLPRAGQFPQRNRIISGLSLGVVVVEGRLTSGALITADCALEQGREVFAVPGNIFEETSRAPHLLLACGARLVERAEDILEEFGLRPRRARPATPPKLDGDDARIYGELSLTPQHIDRLAARCGMTAAAVAAVLTRLECAGVVAALPGRQFIRVVEE